MALRSPLRHKVSALYTALVILFLFFPILIVVPMSFSGDRFLGFPPSSIGVRWYVAYFNDASWIELTFRSLRIGLGAAIVATGLGTMAAVGLLRGKIPFKGAINGLFAAPVVVPTIIIALGIFILVLRLRIDDSEITLIFSHATIALPFAVLIVGAALRQVDSTYERAARVLGAGPIRAFFHTTFRSILPGVVASAIFSFFISFDELIIALFIMGENKTLPVRLWTDLRFELDPTIAAISTLLIAVTTLGMIAADYLRRRATKRDRD